MTIHVRERPPLRLTHEIETPGGRTYRWASDEPLPENVPGGVRRTSTMPGGFAECDGMLPRQPGRDYPDLERFSIWRQRSIAEVVGEYRLERTPRVYGDKIAISPSAVGLQAHLDDDKSAVMIFIDRDLSHWGPMSRQRHLEIVTGGTYTVVDGSVEPGTDLPALTLKFNLDGKKYACEMWYDAGAGALVGLLHFDWDGVNLGTVDGGDANWNARLLVADDDVRTNIWPTDNLLQTTDSGSGYHTPDVPQRYAVAEFSYGAAIEAFPNVERVFNLRNVAVYGPHDLPLQAITGEPDGLLASDMAAYAIETFAPGLNFTTGTAGTIQPSEFVIPHAVFLEPGGIGAWIRDLTRYELLDWAVWENATYHQHERGARGRNWRARVGAMRLEETGPQADRVWNSVIVAYRDVDGKTRTVGPPGSGADTEDAALEDTDPENPANKLGIIRRDLLQMGTAVPRSAIKVGEKFLAEAKVLDTSGRAVFVGHVEDDRGVLHPYSHVRAGDTVTPIDGHDHSARRIVRADHDDTARAVSIDIDAPPEGLQALLERLGVALIPLGL